MAKKAVIDAVEATITAWPNKPKEMRVNGKPQVDGTGELFILIQYPVANSSKTTHSKSFVEIGAARIVIHAPRNSGTAKTVELGETIASMFRDKKIGGVEFKTPGSPLIHDDNEDLAYFKTSVVIPYHFHFDDPD